MASKPDFEAATQQMAERFAAAARNAFTAVANALRPAIEAVAEFARTFVANRRIRRAVHLQRWPSGDSEPGRK